MDENKIAQFIVELRKEKKMTQKELAAQLHITDKAVSKWERGLNCPDIALLTSLADILGVTTSELLNGQRSKTTSDDVTQVVDNALFYADKSVKGKVASFRNTMAIAFSSFLLLGIIVVSVINLMVSDTFTWSLIPISISVFAWLVFFPAIKFGIKGVIGSFINISVFLIPFLYALDRIINNSIEHHVPIFSMGISIAPILIVSFWAAFFIFKKLWARKLLCSAILVLLLSPITFLINFFLDITQGQGQIWSSTLSSINALIPFAVAIILFAIDFMIRKK